jgi:Terpene cyclase DEP1
MSIALFHFSVALIGALFILAFCVVVVPAFIETPDIIAAFAGGFVNPFASGYSLDVVFCWCLLAIWVLFEAKEKGIRFGWVALVVGVVPGVAAGFALYLLIRYRR